MKTKQNLTWNAPQIESRIHLKQQQLHQQFFSDDRNILMIDTEYYKVALCKVES